MLFILAKRIEAPTPDRIERAEAVAGIRQDMAEVERGEGIPLEKAAMKLRSKHGFSR